MTPASSRFELRWDQTEDTKSFWLHQLADFAVSAIGSLGGTTDFNTIIAVWDKQTEAVAHRVKTPANDGGWFWASIQRDLNELSAEDFAVQWGFSFPADVQQDGGTTDN